MEREIQLSYLEQIEYTYKNTLWNAGQKIHLTHYNRDSWKNIDAIIAAIEETHGTHTRINKR